MGTRFAAGISSAATSAAVNEVTITSTDTGNGPTIEATGETNVDLNINSKGTGAVFINGLATKMVEIGDWNMDTAAQASVAQG